MTDLSGAGAIENDPASKASIARQQAEAAAGNAEGSAPGSAYPRVLTSGGARDSEWVYPSEVTLSFDTEADALAAVAAARADGRHVSPISGGDFVSEEGANDWRAAIELDKSTRYPLSDHTGGR